MASSDQSDWSSSEEIDNYTGFVVEIAILALQKSICVDCDCDIQISENDFQRTVNQTVMYR